jgi:hypothetical protein
MAVDVKTSANDTFEAGNPRTPFRANPATVFTGRNSWDVTQDEQRFLINSAGLPTPITVVLN